MNYWAEFDSRLGILLKHGFRERILRQHELLWQLLTNGVAIPPIFFSPVQFQIKKAGGVEQLMQNKGPQTHPWLSPPHRESCPSHTAPFLEGFFQCCPIISHTCVLSPQHCSFPVTTWWKQSCPKGNSFGRPQLPTAGLSEPSHKSQGRLDRKIFGSRTHRFIFKSHALHGQILS